MLLLLLFAFLAGIVTVLSPCILPVLPIVLSTSVGSVQHGYSRAVGVIVGFVGSFTVFTLFLSAALRICGAPASSLRWVALVLIAIFGVSLLLPRFQAWLEGLFSRLSSKVPNLSSHQGFFGGILIGFSLGLLWTPCVGPILASVIALSLSGEITLASVFITAAYATGTAIPMFFVLIGGRALLQRVPWLLSHTQQIQRAFGVVMIVTAIGLFFQVDRTFQTWVLETFPRYGQGLTKFEGTPSVLRALDQLNGRDVEEETLIMNESHMSLPPSSRIAPELVVGGDWINSEPLSLASLRGKVVLVDFWTYSCINCQRTLPYLKQWHDLYRDQGLVVIGVHAPEFAFEQDADNVRKAVTDFGITYPVMQDNDFATWRAYKNQYWPAKYLIDAEGHIRYTHFGEGDYDKTDEAIRSLLEEAGASASAMIPGEQMMDSFMNMSKTAETYFGYKRLGAYASPELIHTDAVRMYSLPALLKQNQFAFFGEWNVMAEYAVPSKGAHLVYSYSAQDVYLVAGVQDSERPVRVRITIDGEHAPETEDVGLDGVMTISSDRLYHIGHTNPGAHTIDLEFLEGGSEVYTFTFG